MTRRRKHDKKYVLRLNIFRPAEIDVINSAYLFDNVKGNITFDKTILSDKIITSDRKTLQISYTFLTEKVKGTDHYYLNICFTIEICHFLFTVLA